MGGDSEIKWGTKEDEVRVGHHLVNKSQKWKEKSYVYSSRTFQKVLPAILSKVNTFSEFYLFPEQYAFASQNLLFLFISIKMVIYSYFNFFKKSDSLVMGFYFSFETLNLKWKYPHQVSSQKETLSTEYNEPKEVKQEESLYQIGGGSE